MNFKEPKFYFLILIFLAITIAGYYFLPNLQITGSSTQEIDEESLESKFNILSNSNTNICAGPQFLTRVNSDRIQGSCCSAMDFHRYTEQINGLKKYSYIIKIPLDPYDIQKSLADELLKYQKNIKLNKEQQKVYDQAVKLSHEGGPCCCKCWRWYAFEGLAKYLITEYEFNPEQIAEIWDLEDGCGGKGHIDHPV